MTRSLVVAGLADVPGNGSRAGLRAGVLDAVWQPGRMKAGRLPIDQAASRQKASSMAASTSAPTRSNSLSSIPCERSPSTVRNR